MTEPEYLAAAIHPSVLGLPPVQHIRYPVPRRQAGRLAIRVSDWPVFSSAQPMQALDLARSAVGRRNEKSRYLLPPGRNPLSRARSMR